MKYLYTSPLPEASATDERNRLGQQLATQGLLGGAEAIVTPISSNAADLQLTGQYRWGPTVSSMLAAELDEIADAGVSELPLYRRDGSFANAGYYAVERADVEPLHANQRAAWQYTLSLTKEGTRESHWRTVETDRSQLTHPWGNSTVAEVGVPASATDLQWLDRETGQTTAATPTATRAAELTDVMVVDQTDAPTRTAALLADLALADLGPADVRVWDTRGTASRTDSDGIVRWQKCFATSHPFDGAAVITNGLVRVRLGDTLTVEHWDDSAGAWTTTALGTSDWSLARWELRTIGLAQARARVWFADGSAQQPLDCRLARGVQEPQWSEPDGADATPPGLVDLLAPVASERIYHVGPTLGLTPREGL